MVRAVLLSVFLFLFICIGIAQTAQYRYVNPNYSVRRLSGEMLLAALKPIPDDK